LSASGSLFGVARITGAQAISRKIPPGPRDSGRFDSSLKA